MHAPRGTPMRYMLMRCMALWCAPIRCTPGRCMPYEIHASEIHAYEMHTHEMRACNHWQDHLRSIKTDAVDKTTKAKITANLLNMIRDATMASRWMSKQRTLEKTWFNQDRNRSRLRDWLKRTSLTRSQKSIWSGSCHPTPRLMLMLWTLRLKSWRKSG
jgi:hypothetical protein